MSRSKRLMENFLDSKPGDFVEFIKEHTSGDMTFKKGGVYKVERAGDERVDLVDPKGGVIEGIEKGVLKMVDKRVESIIKESHVVYKLIDKIKKINDSALKQDGKLKSFMDRKPTYLFSEKYYENLTDSLLTLLLEDE